MKIIDILISPVLILIFLPLALVVSLLIYIEDGGNPFYISKRIGKNGIPFKLYKFRSMRLLETSTVDSTSNNDPRITKIGRWIRQYKIDELPQLFNVLFGSMSLVGPRPNVQREVDSYTRVEMRLLEVKPGMTDISSIIFSDLGAILQEHNDPDLSYNQLVRPWKGRLSLFYLENKSVVNDLIILFLTFVIFISRSQALKLTNLFLRKLNAPNDLAEISLRKKKLVPLPPVGSDQIVLKRGV